MDFQPLNTKRICKAKEPDGCEPPSSTCFLQKNRRVKWMRGLEPGTGWLRTKKRAGDVMGLKTSARSSAARRQPSSTSPLERAARQRPGFRSRPRPWRRRPGGGCQKCLNQNTHHVQACVYIYIYMSPSIHASTHDEKVNIYIYIYVYIYIYLSVH